MHRQHTRVVAAKAAPAKSTRATRVSKLRQPTISSKKKQHQALAAILQSPVKSKQFWKSLKEIDIQVEQAMAVLDQETGKLLNYRQLLKSPKYNKKWSISSANEFGNY
jgi:hypothetical protein